MALGLERLLTWARAAGHATLAKSTAPLTRSSGPLTRRSALLAPLLRLGLLATLAFSSARLLGRNTVWQSRATLFRSASKGVLFLCNLVCNRSGLASTPGNAKVWYNYANYLRDQVLAPVAENVIDIKLSVFYVFRSWTRAGRRGATRRRCGCGRAT